MDNQKDEENIGSFYMGRTRTPPEPKRLLPPGVLTVIALIALGGIVWYAYPRGAEKYTNVDVPVVKADTAPIKAEPVDPGGMEVRHQDSTVFSAMEKNGDGEVEKLLPTPEEPLDKNEVLQPEAKPPVIPSSEPPKLDLDMKDVGNGAEKIIPPEVEEKPAPAARAEPGKAEAKKAETKKVEVKPALPAAAGAEYEVQLGSYRDMEGLKKDWDRLKKKYAAQLGNLKMRAVKADIPGKGTYYRLQAGKVTKDKARELCDVLKAGKVGCILAK